MVYLIQREKETTNQGEQNEQTSNHESDDPGPRKMAGNGIQHEQRSKENPGLLPEETDKKNQMNYKTLLTAAILTNGGKLTISDEAIYFVNKKHTPFQRMNDSEKKCLFLTTDAEAVVPVAKSFELNRSLKQDIYDIIWNEYSGSVACCMVSAEKIFEMLEKRGLYEKQQ